MIQTRLTWVFAVALHFLITSTPAVPSSGHSEIVNRQLLQGLPTALLGVWNDRIIVHTYSGELVSVAFSTGAEQWRQKIPGSYPNYWSCDKGILHVVTHRGIVSALKLDSGVMVWQVTLPTDLSARGPIHFSPSGMVRCGRVIVFSSSFGAVCGVDTETGKVIWDQKLASPDRVQVIPMPGNRLMSMATDGRFWILDPATGSHSVRSRLAVGGVVVGRLMDRMFLRTEDTVACVSIESGKLLWKASGVLHSRLYRTHPIVSSNSLCLVVCRTTKGAREVRALHLSDGKPAWRLRLDGHIRESPLLLNESQAVVVHDSGTDDRTRLSVVWFDPRNGKVQQRKTIDRRMPLGPHVLLLHDRFLLFSTWQIIHVRFGEAYHFVIHRLPVGH